ncbi:MAG: 2-dehydropantoate 2-reductase [Ignavibacteria bacterium]|nr:2-dehydropantoate 2-reductase [Ignavibacteria bacterium]
MKFLIVGAGGVGGYFGGKLALNGQDVWFIARGNHLKAMRSSGLHIHSSEGRFTVPPGKMTDRIAEAGPADVVLFCVKAYDTDATARLMIPVVKPETIVISLQNGIDNEATLRQVLPRGIVYGGVSFIYSTITAYGVVTETGGPKKITFGPMPGTDVRTEDRGRLIQTCMREAGINAEFSDDIVTAMWEKFIFITAVAGLTALTRLTLGEILAVHETRSMLVEAMREVEAIAKRKGAHIAPGHVNSVMQRLRSYDNNTRSSLYYDLTHHRPMEIDALSGAVLRYGSELGIPTPMNAVLYAALLPHHLNHMSRRA